jgi:hypothetical protein
MYKEPIFYYYYGEIGIQYFTFLAVTKSYKTLTELRFHIMLNESRLGNNNCYFFMGAIIRFDKNCICM